MRDILPILSVAFASFCVWLAVRIVNRRERWAKWTAVALIVSASYPVAYLALLDRKLYWPVGADPVTQQVTYETLPSYRVNEPSVERFFAPVHRVDRVLRNDFWNTIELSNGQKWKNPSGVTVGGSSRT